MVRESRFRSFLWFFWEGPTLDPLAPAQSKRRFSFSVSPLKRCRCYINFESISGRFWSPKVLVLTKRRCFWVHRHCFGIHRNYFGARRHCCGIRRRSCGDHKHFFGAQGHCFGIRSLVDGECWLASLIFFVFCCFRKGPTLDPLAPAQSKRSFSFSASPLKGCRFYMNVGSISGTFGSPKALFQN